MRIETEEVKDSDVETLADEEATAATTVLSKPITQYITISSLNVRSGAGTNHSAIDTVTEGEEVTVYETNGSWSKVEFANQTGWVSSNYLSDTKPAVKKTTTVAVTTENESTSTPSTTKKEESKPKETSNVADGLKTVDKNKQLILVTTNGTNTSNATIQTFEKDGNGKWQPVLNVSGHVGKNGLASNKVEGDKRAPIGKYTIGTAFGTKGNPGTKLPFRNITDDDVWVDDSDSSLYNTWQSKSKTQGQWNSAENMKIGAYANGFVINYNTQRTPGKGSAIFFHIGNSYTLGCTATSEANVVKIMKWLDPSKNPVIIQTPTENISNY
ncbi:SH3 domain-containing protein [Paraliobacillus sediminis]|uniref:SH3 domain-containing protein n=1 Tax=Paraliobacillus sediminis TaxID=1885916 RepID=UPI001F07CED8|nr:SH3 domain-containing protein [Paraliobacillus sediminis]